MLEQMLAWKAAIIGVWLVGFLLLERLFPASPWKPENRQQGFSHLKHLGQNASLWAVNLLISPLLVIAFTAVAAEHAPGWRGQWQAEGPRWFTLALALDLLILDLWIYGWHRMNHRFPFAVSPDSPLRPAAGRYYRHAISLRRSGPLGDSENAGDFPLRHSPHLGGGFRDSGCPDRYFSSCQHSPAGSPGAGAG